MSSQIETIASNIIIRKQSEVESYVLLLGAGASVSSGCSTLMQIADDVLQSREPAKFKEWESKIENASSINPHYGKLVKKEFGPQKLDLFYEIWGRMDHETQYSILRGHLWNGKIPSEGYIHLANIIKNGYIKIILSTNLDNLLEKALNKIGLIQPDDFITIVNGKDKPEEIRNQIETNRVPIKIIKLHGSLESPLSYAFSPKDIYDFGAAIKPNLSRVLNQSLIIVGHTMQDRDLDILFEEEGNEIHFVNPNPPESNSRIDIILKARGRGGVISGEDGKFDKIFGDLWSSII